MTKWPPASRLTDALRRKAARAEASPDAWDEIGARIEGRVRPVDFEMDKDLPGRRPAWRDRQSRIRLLALAASVVVLAGLAIALPDRDGETVDTDGPAAVPSTTTVQVPTTSASSVPVLADLDCASVPVDAERRFVSTRSGGLISVATAHNEEGREFIMPVALTAGSAVSVADSVLADAAYSMAVEVDSLTTVADVGDAALAWISVGCDLVTNPLILDGSPRELGEALYCEEFPGPGLAFSALVVLGGDGDPFSCGALQPTMLIDDRQASSASVAAWADAHGCARPSSDSDDDGNQITAWESCDTTLIHVEVSDDDLLAASIAGQPIGAYALSILDFAT